MKFHFKTWSLLSGVTVSLALVGGCSSEPTPESAPPPAAKEGTSEAAKAPPPTATEGTATPPPAVEAPAPAPATESPKAEEPKEEPKKEESPK